MSEVSDASDCAAAVRDWLANSPNIVNVVEDRIYPEGDVPQGIRKDRIVIGEVAASPDMRLAGESGSGETILDIDFWSSGERGRLQAKIGGELIRKRLSGYRGALNSDITAACCEFTSLPRLIVTGPQDGGSLQHWRCNMTVRIRHTVAVPDFS
jgi:hypothetical protein